MDRLESKLGIRLLDRAPTGITPTTAGELLYAHARLIREEIDLAEKRVQGENGHAHVVTFGTLPSLASSVVPLAVSRWRERHPGVLLRVVEKIQVELLLGLLRLDSDFVLGQTEYFDFFLEGVCPMVGWPQRTILEKLLASEGVASPTQLVECGSIDFTKSLVAASDHLAMLPAHCVAADLREGTIGALAITVPALKRDIAVSVRRWTA